MSDRIFAILALAGLVAFLGILPWYVPEPDLIIVVTLVIIIACRDIWGTLRDTERKTSDN